MKLRCQKSSPALFRQPALELKAQIQTMVQAPQLYHWAKNPAIPADNHRAERELRPLVIARKISFGSQSEQGAQTREVLMSVLLTLRKRNNDVLGAFKRALDKRAEDETRDPYKLLFDSS